MANYTVCGFTCVLFASSKVIARHGKLFLTPAEIQKLEVQYWIRYKFRYISTNEVKFKVLKEVYSSMKF